MSRIADAMRAFLNTKQKENETLLDYTQRYKTICNIMESHIRGPIIIKEYIKLTKEYIKDKIEAKNDTNKKMLNPYDDKFDKSSANKLYAYIYIS